MRTTGLVLLLLLGCKSKGELPPIANAGLDQAITAGASTSLDGSASSDPGGEIAGFSWTLISLPSGSLGGLTGKEAAAPSLVTDLPGRYVASLVVTDNEGNTSTPDVVEVIALTPSSDRPEARLMATGDLGLGVLLKLDGSASSAPEGRTVSSWSFDVVHAPPGASADIDEGDKPWDATFTPDVKGTWVLGLTVADEEASSRQATVVLPVEAFPDLAPVARCGADQAVATGSLVELDGTDSFDPEGAALSYSWTLEPPERSDTVLVRSDTPTPRFVADVKGDYIATLVVSDGGVSSTPCTALVSASKTPGNQAPVAFAGGAQSVSLAGSEVTLDGSDSFDPDGDPITHTWTLLSGPVGSSLSSADISDNDQPIASFTPDAGGTFVLGLQVCDASLCAEDSAEVSVGNPGDNQPPVANAGEDTATEVGLAATLDGSGSSDPDGDPMTYAWTIDVQPSGSAAIVEDADQATASIQPDVDGLYVLRLTVDDGLASDSDLVKVEVVPEGTNLPPVCEEAEDQTVDIGDVVLLDGSGTTDPNGDTLTFLWTLLSRPEGSAAGIDSPTSEITALRPDLAGDYQVQFQAMDGTDNCFFQFVVTVEDNTPNTPPTCDGGGDLDVDVGEVATLDGTGSSDVDGDPLTWTWRLVDVPGGSTATITDDESALAQIIPDVEGLYTVELVVSDGVDSCATGIVISATVPDDNDPPICRISADSIVEAGEPASLDASGTSDPDGDELTYSWTVLSGPEGGSSSFLDASAVATSWTADTAGSYQIELVVSDGTESCSDVIEIDVTESDNNPPECDAGPDLTAEIDEEVELDARGTTDPDGDLMTFRWQVIERPEGSTATISDLTLRLAHFTPDVAGSYTIRFTADDGTDACQDDMVLSVAGPENNPPECDAGPDLTAEVDEEVELDARGTVDPDGDLMIFQWRIITRPEGSTATISDLTLRLAHFTPDVAGSYTIRFYADDGTDTCQDDMVLSVTGPENNPPECNAGPDLTAEVDEEVELDARGTVDPDGDLMIFQWRVITRPAGSTATISDLTLRLAHFTPDVAGSYTIRFYADDGIDTCQDDMVLTVTDSTTNTPPVADAGSPQTLCAVDPVDLDGSGSSDADGDLLTYAWSFTSLPSGSALTDADLSGSDTARPSFTPDLAGIYTVELTVDDGSVTDTDTVTISINGDGAVLMLHLDETSGTSAADGSPSGLDGTLTGGTWSGGRFFGALGFDGSNWLTVPDDDALDITDDFTIDWWMRTDDVGSTWQAVLTKGTDYNYSIWIYQDELYFYGVTTSLGYVNAGTTASIGDGTWHHYAVTVSGGVITVYEDAAVIDSASYSGTLRTTEEDLHLGRPNYTTSFYMFEGALDEVTIRDRTLDTGEITALAEADTQVCTGAEDTDAPSAAITAPGGGSADIGFVRVEGTASDASAIKSISVNGADAAATDENFSTWVAYVPLSEGDNTLVVRAEDVAGNVNSSADSVTIFYEDTCGDDTVLLLAFDEETGGTALDWSEGGLHATDSGTGRVIGRFGNAGQFDGSSASQVPHDDILSAPDEFSIEAWIRQDTGSVDAEFILHKGYPANYGMGAWGGFVLFGFTDSAGTDVNIFTPDSYADGDWHHVVGVYDGTDLSLYVDASLVASESAGGLTPATNTQPLSIGGLGGLSEFFTGELDQVRVYDEALGTSEVVELYDEGEACPLGDNLSAGATATASTTLNPLFTAENTIDGDTSEAGEFDYTMWLTENGVNGWVELDFGEVVGVLGVRWANTHNRTFLNRATTDYRIVASASRAFESEGVVIESGTGSLETDLVFHNALPASPIAARYLRIYVEDFEGVGGGINEIEVFGLE